MPHSLAFITSLNETALTAYINSVKANGEPFVLVVPSTKSLVSEYVRQMADKIITPDGEVLKDREGEVQQIAQDEISSLRDVLGTT